MRIIGAAMCLAGWMLWAGAASAATAQVPEGYRLAQQMSTGDGGELELLEDARISADLHQSLWGNGSAFDEDAFDDEALAKDVANRPIVEARLRLLSASGEEVESVGLAYPLATLEKASMAGMPSPAFFLTVDQTAPMGSYSGPATQILMPALHKLQPMQSQAADGTLKPLFLAQTGKAAWQASDALPEILQVSSSPADDESEDFVTVYRTYRLKGDVWQFSSREENSYWESEGDFPQRSAFP
ncbi:hypothetical protein [Pseudomonas asplenii]|uniref:hypothetical protein n=1 Tax=Pseudomonas asplenii TaxID=53407 RepID=UPI0022342940|nr:hypothetical protein [Pseudomonas asplenii]UZE29912.1 hypothetical protein LOY63_03980 [Pseudomonas asplenii]